MNKYLSRFLIILLCAGIAIGFASCKKEEEPVDTNEQTELDAQDTEDAEEEQQAEMVDYGEAAKTIEPDAEDVIGKDEPMQITSVILYEDGSIRVIPNEDLKKNELDGSSADSLMPFAESGEAKDIYLLKIGNDGYRTIVALMDDGTISAINTRALIEDHIIAVMDNVGGRDSFVNVIQEKSEDGFSIVGETKEGDEVILDPVLLQETGDY